MIWINLLTSVIRAPEYVGAEPVQRATWLNVLAYSCEQENHGKIVGCRSWKDRRWQQTCGVTLSEVDAAAPLLVWEGEDLIVWSYPSNKQAEIEAKRDAGRRCGKSRSDAKLQAVRSNLEKARESITQSSPQSSARSSPQSCSQTEWNGMEGKGMEWKDTVVSSDDDAHAIYDIYPRKTAKNAALKAIQRALKAKPAAYLKERTTAYCAVVACWPESERHFIPHPATWFNRGSYDDDPKTWERGSSNAPAAVGTYQPAPGDY